MLILVSGNLRNFHLYTRIAQRPSRIRAWGCCLFVYKGFSQDLHLRIVHSPALFFINLNSSFRAGEGRRKHTMARNYWLHRISHENGLSNVLLEKRNELSIGFSDFSEDKFLNRVLSNPNEFDSIMIEYGWTDLPKSRFSLYRFLCEIKRGDYILVPTPYTFSVYEIVGDKPFSNESLNTNELCDVWGKPISLKNDGYLHNENEENKIVDLGFYWNVRPIKTNIPRTKYADQALTSRMKARQTILKINDLEKNILESIQLFEKNTPINLHNLAIEKMANQLLSLIQEKIDADKFERLVKWYMESIGGKAIIPSKNDSIEGDADVIAYFELIKVAILIQVKKHINNTDKWAVEQIKSYKENKDLGDYSYQLWIISTCDDFTREAKDKAEDTNVRLINGHRFAEMLLEVGLKGMNI